MRKPLIDEMAKQVHSENITISSNEKESSSDKDISTMDETQNIDGGKDNKMVEELEKYLSAISLGATHVSDSKLEVREKTSPDTLNREQNSDEGHKLSEINVTALEKNVGMANTVRRVTFARPPSFKDIHGLSQDQVRGKKLSTARVAILIVASVTGVGVVGLPRALKNTGWFGVFLFLLIGINSLYAGLCLGWCWVIIEERWPEYRGDQRSPFPAIALKAAGKWMKYIVIGVMHFSAITSCVHCLLYLADSLDDAIGTSINFCALMLIFIVLIIPFIYFERLRQLWWMGIIDVLASVLFVTALIVTMTLDKRRVGAARYDKPNLISFGKSFGMAAYAYGGAHMHPTIQNNMEKKKEFPQAVVTAYIVIILFYMPVQILGYIVYGEGAKPSILHNLQSTQGLETMKDILDIVHALQLATTFIISIHPTFQNMEDIFNCSKNFSVKMCIIRLSVILFILTIGLSIPFTSQFMPILGAFSSNLISIVLPPIFYVSLIFQSDPRYPKRRLSIKHWILLMEAVVVGIIVGCYGTYVSINSLNSDRWLNSCVRDFTSSFHSFSI